MIQNTKRLSQKDFENIYTRVPRLCVDLVIKMDGGVILSLRSIEPYRDWWHLPGGTVYFRERLHDAVRRVALDECGIEVRVVKMLNYIEYPSYEQFPGEGNPVSIAFLCQVTGGKLRGSDQGEEVRAFKILPEKLIPEQKEFLEKVNFLELRKGLEMAKELFG